MTFNYRSRLRGCGVTFVCMLIMPALLLGCSTKTSIPESAEMLTLSATITEIDDHGNAVTDILSEAFTERGWHLGDTLEATFATAQPIRFQFVEDYGDVPVGEYLGRFSTSTGRFKIAINHGSIAETLQLKSASQVTLRKVELAAPVKEVP